MISDGTLLKEARQKAVLSVEQVAMLADVDVAELLAIEAGTVQASPRVLDTFARAWGISLSDLLDGRANESASSFLFRSFHESGPSFQTLARSGALFTLGDFLRCARGVGELREKLGLPSAARANLERLAASSKPSSSDTDLFVRAERLAQSVRRDLNLGDGSIGNADSAATPIGFVRVGADLQLLAEHLDKRQRE